MKRIIKKTFNKLGQRCKTYVLDYNGSVIFLKFTLIKKPENYRYDVGGEMLVKETDRYLVTFHRFGIKKSTLFDALSLLGLLDNQKTNLTDVQISEYILDEISIPLYQSDIDNNTDANVQYLNAVHWAKWGRDNANGL